MEQGSKEMKLQGRYPEYTVYSHPIPQRALAIATLLLQIVRVAMYFRSTFVESCNQIHFWKAETSLKPKTNVSI